MQSIMEAFPITTSEYEQLDSKFGGLCHYAAWQLYKKNNRNNLTDEQEDIVQELRIALIRAGSYYKRQTFIEASMKVAAIYIKGRFAKMVLKKLVDLWLDRTRHGANRQKFGAHQEAILNQLVESYVPKNERPSPTSPLVIDNKFIVYCKRIAWNAQKLMGKKITREKSWRTGLTSLSDYDYLGTSLN